MSGHSKLVNIKHKKERNDTAEGKIFTAIGREIAVAVKEGGVDPTSSSRLRDIIVKAKTNSIPSDTINRNTGKAAGDANSVNYETLTYEGYGPNDVAIIVDTLTDNRNRTAANVRSALTKGSGDAGTSGSASYTFDRKGQTVVDKEECDMDPDELMVLALDTEAEDFSEEEDSYEVVTAPEDFSAVRGAPEAQSIPTMRTDVTMIPQTWVELTDENDIKRLSYTLDLLDEDDDVQAVYHNWDG